MKAYPYARWPKVEASAVPGIKRAARGRTDPGEVLNAIAELAGCKAHYEAPKFRSVTPEERSAALAGPRTAVALVHDEDIARRFLVELTPPLAMSLVDRLLGGDGDLSGGLGLSDGQRGVLAFVAAEAVAKCRLPLRVATVMRTAKAIDGFLGQGTSLVWASTITLGHTTGAGRVWMPASMTFDVAEALPRSVPVTMVADAAEGVVSAEVLRALNLDDVLFFDKAEQWQRDGAFETRLRALGGERRTWWLHEGAVLRIEEGISAVGARGERMDKGSDTAATQVGAATTAAASYDAETRPMAQGLSAVGDAPVTVSLEVARFVLPVDEIARLAPGEVVSAGATIGDEARLRAGDRVIAVGELVDIDGQVGLRITRLP